MFSCYLQLHIYWPSVDCLHVLYCSSYLSSLLANKPSCLHGMHMNTILVATIVKCNTAIQFLTQVISLSDAILVFSCVTQITIQCLVIVMNFFITQWTQACDACHLSVLLCSYLGRRPPHCDTTCSLDYLYCLRAVIVTIMVLL